MTQQYHAPPPTYPQGPPPTPKKNWFARHKIMTVLGALLLLIVVASIASSGGGTDTATTTPPAGAKSQPAQSAEQPQASADQPTNKFPMQDGDWRLDSVQLKDDGLGDFGGRARITYTGDDQNGGDNAFTITVFKNGKDIASLDGLANTVMPGKTVTVDLWSMDRYQKGPYTYDFQNNW